MPWSKYSPGAENKRIEQYLPICPIYVTLIDLRNNDKIVLEAEIDYSSPAGRKWLGRLTFWAITNGHSVETMHKDDSQPPIKEG